MRSHRSLIRQLATALLHRWRSACLVGIVRTRRVLFPKIRFDSIANQVNEFGIHELVVIRNVENMQWRFADRVPKRLEEARTVFGLHYEENVGPYQISLTKLSRRPNTEPTRPNRKSGVVAENAFCRRAAPLIS